MMMVLHILLVFISILYHLSFSIIHELLYSKFPYDQSILGTLSKERSYTVQITSSSIRPVLDKDTWYVLKDLFQGFENQESFKKGMNLYIIICYFPIHLGKLNF